MFQIAVQSLQAIHDVQLLGFIHRGFHFCLWVIYIWFLDIRPSNFFIRRRYKRIAIGGFDFAYNMFRDRDHVSSTTRCVFMLLKINQFVMVIGVFYALFVNTFIFRLQ